MRVNLRTTDRIYDNAEVPVHVLFRKAEPAVGPESVLRIINLNADASGYPAGYAMFLLSLLDYRDPVPKVMVICSEKSEVSYLHLELPVEAAVILRELGEEYPLKNGRSTFYVCRGHSCLPPVNKLPDL